MDRTALLVRSLSSNRLLFRSSHRLSRFSSSLAPKRHRTIPNPATRKSSLRHRLLRATSSSSSSPAAAAASVNVRKHFSSLSPRAVATSHAHSPSGKFSFLNPINYDICFWSFIELKRSVWQSLQGLTMRLRRSSGSRKFPKRSSESASRMPCFSSTRRPAPRSCRC